MKYVFLGSVLVGVTILAFLGLIGLEHIVG